MALCKHRSRVSRDCLSNLPIELQYEVIRHLPLKTLGRLARVSQLFREIVTPILYKQDADEERPRAIYWAASTTEADDEAITKVLDLAKQYGGDLNRLYFLGTWRSPPKATPLHIAAAIGNMAAARRLLELGAEVNALGRENLDPEDVADPSIRHAADHGLWRPLFVPLVSRNEEMIQLLLRFGASPVLLVPVDNPTATAHEPGTVNILHIFSADPDANITDGADQSYSESLKELIDVPIQRGSTTPLFLALRHHNGRALKKLIVNGANIEALNEFGRTLLTQAISLRFTSSDAQARLWYNGVAEQLVKSRKPKISGYSPQEAWETPLTCTIKALENIPADYKRATQDVEAMIDLLLKHGADINEKSNEGNTMLHALCDVICRKSFSINGLLDIFRRCVDNGADLTIPFASGRSVLGTCMLRHNQRPLRFFQLLLEMHAPLMPSEVDAVFVKWAQSFSLRKSLDGYVQEYRTQVSQNAIDLMYLNVLGYDEVAWKQLQEHFPRTTIAERVVSEILLGPSSRTRWFKLALDVQGFDGNYINKHGNSLLHCIVDRLDKNLKYRDIQARSDACELLRRGAIPNQTNARGQTPLQALRSFQEQRNCPVLRLFLYDATALWDDLQAGLATEDQWRGFLEIEGKRPSRSAP